MTKNAAADVRVVNAMGDKFAEFQKLALLAKENPATRSYAESQMAKLLEKMTPAERIELRRALIAAGVR